MNTLWKIVVLALILLVHTMSGVSWADTIVVGECVACTDGGIKDGAVYNYAPNNNYGQSVSMYYGYLVFGPGTEYRWIIEIDLSALPPGSTVTAATLELYVEAVAASADIELYEIAAANDNWIEGAGTTISGSLALTGEPCWNKKIYNTVNWAGAAGLSTPTTDFINTVLGTLAVSSTGSKTITLNAAGRAALENNAGGAIGLLIRDTTYIGIAYITMATGESVTDARRPKATITYTPPAAGGGAQVILVGP